MSLREIHGGAAAARTRQQLCIAGDVGLDAEALGRRDGAEPPQAGEDLVEHHRQPARPAPGHVKDRRCGACEAATKANVWPWAACMSEMASHRPFGMHGTGSRWTGCWVRRAAPPAMHAGVPTIHQLPCLSKPVCQTVSPARHALAGLHAQANLASRSGARGLAGAGGPAPAHARRGALPDGVDQRHAARALYERLHYQRAQPRGAPARRARRLVPVGAPAGSGSRQGPSGAEYRAGRRSGMPAPKALRGHVSGHTQERKRG